MRIVTNTSGYDTRALRSLICRVHRHMARVEGRAAPNWKTLRVAVRGRKKHGHVTGYAYFNGAGYKWDVFLRLPQHCSERTFAWIVYHELMHTYDYRHGQFTDLSERQADDMGLSHGPLPLAVRRPRSRRDLRAERHASAVARLAAWQTKARRAATAIAKLKRQVRYYERVAAAAAGKQQVEVSHDQVRGQDHGGVAPADGGGGAPAQ